MAEQPGRNGTGGRNSVGRERWTGELLAYGSKGASGQIAVMFALSMLAIVPLMGLIFDGGNIYVQRRTAQNAADAGSLAGTRALMHAAPSPDPTLPGGEATIAEAICQYVTANAFGTTPKATANFVGVAGTPLTGIPAITLPTDPADSTHTVLKCGIPTFNSIPNNAAGVNVDATIGPFPTFIAGFLGRGIASGDGAGIAQATTKASAGVQGTAVTAFNANNAPFIICGVSTMTTSHTYQSVLLMSGGTPVLPYQIDPAAVGQTFIIHAPHVALCGAPDSSFKGLANGPANAGTSTLPADLAVLPGNRAGPTQAIVDGVSGCAIGQDDPLHPCVMMVPIATTTTDAGQTMHCVLWAAFLIKTIDSNNHTAKLLANYNVGGGPQSFTWTWGGRLSVSTTSVALSH